MKKYLLPFENVLIDGLPGLFVRELNMQSMSMPNPYIAIWQEQRFEQATCGLVPKWTHTMCSPVTPFDSLEEAKRDAIKKLEDEGYEFLTEEKANKLKVML